MASDLTPTTAPVTRRWVRFPRPGMPEFARYWYVMQTLVGSSDGSNRNRRFLYQGDEKVVTFNHRMSRDWHPDDDAALHALCRYLNEREFPETEEPKAVMDQPQTAAWQPRELIRLETLRQHDMQALGAAISRRDWQSTEMAYNQLRDKFDRAITELKHHIERAGRVFGDALAVRVNMNTRLGDVPAHVIREAIALALVEALSHD